MLGVISDVIPKIPLVVVVLVGAVAVGLFLADEGPRLIEPQLGRPGGERPSRS